MATMNRYLWRIFMPITSILISCSNYNDNFLDRIDEIKKIGDNNPELALLMLDSLKTEVRDEGEYTRNKYDLLSIRLNDKADNMPASDIAIRKLVEYFESKGSVAEKQEVYYYAGSTYRDLQDTPRALEYFFKALDCAKDYGNERDPIMLRNTYSNLHYLFYMVQDYSNAAEMGITELESCRQTQTDVVLPFMHIGASYLALDSLMQAESALDSAYAYIIKSEDYAKYQESLLFLLYDYSDLGSIEKANKCSALIGTNSFEVFPALSRMAFARHYESIGRNDSAAIYCKQILNDGTDVNNMYEAAKHLFHIYNNAKDVHNACRYADIYMQMSSTIDFGKRQKLAATVNNQYKYHLDQKKEQKLKDDKERYKNILTIASLMALLLASVGYILHIRKRNKQLKVIAGLSSELQRISETDRQLRADIKEKEKELATSNQSLERISNELNNVKQELQHVNKELVEYNEVLKEKEQQLAERMEQNISFIKLLHQTELEGSAEDVIHVIRESSSGKTNMGQKEWKQLFKAIDELYPTFHEGLLKELGNFTEQQKQVCYLMRIGLSKPQIQNMTGLSRVTIWRWVKKFGWILTLEE